MLFNIEMISCFLSDYDVHLFSLNDSWQIRQIQLGKPPLPADPSQLYIYQENDTVYCSTQSGQITVHHASVVDVANCILRNISFYNDWERRALSTVTTSQKLSEYILLLRELFPGFTIKLLDALGRIHYSTDPAEVLPKPMNSTVMNLLRNIPACHKISLGIPGITLFWSPHFKRHYLFGNFIFPDGSFVIFSIFSEDSTPKPLTSLHLHLGQLAQSVFQRSNISSMEQVGLMINRNYVMHVLDNTPVSDTDRQNFELLLDWKISSGTYFVLIDNVPGDSFAARALPYSISRDMPHSFSFNYSGCIVCLIPLTDCARSFQTLESILRPIAFRAGISLPFYSLDDLTSAYQQARFTVSVRSDKEKLLRSCRDYIWPFYLEVLHAGGGVKMVHPDVQSLIDHSSSGSPVLLETLYTYLRCNCSMVDTAAALNLHINTLKYRMNKIRNIISFDPNDYESRMTFLLSCDILRFSHEIE